MTPETRLTLAAIATLRVVLATTPGARSGP